MSGGKGSTRGTPQGGVASPLLSLIYMNRFLKHWRLTGRGEAFRAHVISYADDCAPRRREEGIMSRSTPGSLAAQEMRVGPSGSDCRIRVQTTASCVGPMAEVVSVAEKAGAIPSGVRWSDERE